MPDKPLTRKQLVARADNITRRLISKTADCQELAQELAACREQLANLEEPEHAPKKANGHKAAAADAS